MKTTKPLLSIFAVIAPLASFAAILAPVRLGAQSTEVPGLSEFFVQHSNSVTADSDPQYFVSTDLIALAAFLPNVHLEIRYPGSFSLKTGVSVGPPWPINIPYGDGRINLLAALHIEPRWFFSKRKRFYAGFSLNPMLLCMYGREGGQESGRMSYESNFLFGVVNLLVGLYHPVTERFGMDFNVGAGVAAPWMLPSAQLSVSLAWKL